MTNTINVLDLSNGIGYQVLYYPQIGLKVKKQYPFIRRLRKTRPAEKKIKKSLV